MADGGGSAPGPGAEQEREPETGSPWRRRITRGLTFLGLAVAVVGPFGLVVLGVENDRPLLAVMGLVLGAVVVAIVLRRRPGPPR